MLWLRLFLYLVTAAAVAYSVLPFATLLQEAASGRLAQLNMSSITVENGRAKATIRLTYTGTVQLARFRLVVEPLCPSCRGAEVNAPSLKAGDTLTFDIEAAPGAAFKVELSALVAGLYPVRVEVGEWRLEQAGAGS